MLEQLLGRMMKSDLDVMKETMVTLFLEGKESAEIVMEGHGDKTNERQAVLYVGIRSVSEEDFAKYEENRVVSFTIEGETWSQQQVIDFLTEQQRINAVANQEPQGEA